MVLSRRNAPRVHVANDPNECRKPQNRSFSRLRHEKRRRSWSGGRSTTAQPPESDWGPADLDDGLSPGNYSDEVRGATDHAPPYATQADEWVTMCFDSDDESNEPRATDWQKRNHMKNDLWEQAFPKLTSDMLASSELRLHILHKAASHELALRQIALNESWSLEACACGRVASEVRLSGSRPVRYWGEISTGILDVPRWTCANCEATWEPSPLCARCFPHGNHTLGPLSALEWFDCEILEGLAALGPGTGYLLDGDALAPAGLTKKGDVYCHASDADADELSTPSVCLSLNLYACSLGSNAQ